MKAIHFLAAGALLTLAACSNDEMIQAPESTPIGFDSFIGKVTRADDATLNNVSAITVYGYLGDAGTPRLFDGTLVTKASGDWSYSPLQYWTPAKNYFFTALASPASQGNSQYNYSWSADLPVETTGFYGAGTISFDNSEAAGNEDLIYAYATATTPAEITSAPGRVQFAFKHALSRVKFTFNNAMASDAYSIKIHNLKINNTASTGNLVLGEEHPVWTAAGTTMLELRPNYFTPATGIAANTKAVVSGTKFIIPETKALTISFDIDLIVNGATLATYSHSEVTLPSVDFANGYSYNFVAEINPENIIDEGLYPILFSVTAVEGWIENTPDIDVTL